jgi:hypothetical protein
MVEFANAHFRNERLFKQATATLVPFAFIFWGNQFNFVTKARCISTANPSRTQNLALADESRTCMTKARRMDKIPRHKVWQFRL